MGTLTFWAVFLGALSIAVDVLGIAALEDLIHSVWAYIPNVLAALLIFLVAGAVATALVGTRRPHDGQHADRRDRQGRRAGAGDGDRYVFMILDQLKIANNIVMITYAALIGAIALGIALAFGLGGRDVAGRLLESAYTKGQLAKDDVIRDVQTGVQRGKTQASAASQRLDEGT